MFILHGAVCLVIFTCGGQPLRDVMVILAVGVRYIGESRQIARIDLEVGLDV